MVGTSFHLLLVAPVLFITIICTSSISSIAATGTPALMIFEAAAAASRIVGNVTTATLVSCGMTASFKVISVTSPRVPSDPTKRFVRLYPAEDFLKFHQFEIEPCVGGYRRIPRTFTSFDHCTIGKNNSHVNDPVLHSAIAHGIGATTICPDHTANSSLFN